MEQKAPVVNKFVVAKETLAQLNNTELEEVRGAWTTNMHISQYCDSNSTCTDGCGGMYSIYQ